MILLYFTQSKVNLLKGAFKIFILFKVTTDSHVRIEVRHPVFWSEKIDYDVGFLYKNYLDLFCSPAY